MVIRLPLTWYNVFIYKYSDASIKRREIVRDRLVKKAREKEERERDKEKGKNLKIETIGEIKQSKGLWILN